jgi:hypothetical protein
MKGLFKRIDESLYDAMGKVSHTKISSYIILAGIYLSSLVYLIIDIVNAAMTWADGSTYEIPGAHIGLFTLLLGHHLALLGIKKNSENKSIVKGSGDGNGGVKKEPEPTPDLGAGNGQNIEEDML